MAENRINKKPDGIIEEYRITTDDIRGFISTKCAHFKDGVSAILSTTLWDRSRKNSLNSNKKYVLTMLALSDLALEQGNSETPAFVKDIFLNNTSIKFIDKIWVPIIKKYSYDRKELMDIRKSDKMLDKLEDTLGITEDQLKELIKLSRPHIQEINGDKWVILAIRPEAVIYDMLSSPQSQKIDGRMVISNIIPITKDRVEFVVHIYKGEDRQAPVNNEVLKVLQNA